MKIYDISQTLQTGMAVWPGDPEFRLEPALRIAEGESSNVSALHIGTHSGTHIDAPLHVDESGRDAAGIPLRSCIGPARVIEFPGEICIRSTTLAALDWRGVDRVLFRTRDSDPESLFNPRFTYLHEDASEFLAGKGILLVGIDSPSMDSYDSTDLRSHKMLLGSGAVLLENLRLGHVTAGDYNLICLPLKLAGADGSPVRAILWR